MADEFGDFEILPWQLNADAVSLHLEKFQGRLKITQPSLGVNELLAGHEALPGGLLRVHFGQSRPSIDPKQCSEHYVRGSDVVAVYPADEHFPFRSQVYWRALALEEANALAALEVIVSTQTDLLDSHPRIAVCSALPAIELWRLTDLEKAEFKQVSLAKEGPQQIHYTQGLGCYLWRLSGDRFSFAEMLPPSDFHATDIVRDDHGLVSLSHRLFERSLEKGVILRARVRGVLLERGRDAVSALACYRQLLKSEIPLTA